jgi:hypothetical protein
MRKPNVKKLQAQCDAFNAICPVGGKVRVQLDGKDEPFETVTISEAQILSGHTPVVWMKGVSGCYLLDRVSPIADAQAPAVNERELMRAIKRAVFAIPDEQLTSRDILIHALENAVSSSQPSDAPAQTVSQSTPDAGLSVVTDSIAGQEGVRSQFKRLDAKE